MKITLFHSIFAALFLLSCSWAAAQETKILSKAEILRFEKSQVAIPFPVFRAYAYEDHLGAQDLLLCEKPVKSKGKDTLTNQIAALCFLQDQAGCHEQWSIHDQLDSHYDESSIWFWTKYCSALDLDGDHLIDPVIVYGSKDVDDAYRRIKVIIVYKGKKIVIRAVESDLDYGRSFKKDPQFAQLPVKIRTHINNLLQKMRDEQGLLLKDG